MAEASIPVDLFNPGQVFACLGLIEAADILCGNATGGFDWTDDSDVRFLLSADGDTNPVEVVFDYLADASIRRVGPTGYVEAPPKKKRKSATKASNQDTNEKTDQPQELVLSDTFPDGEGNGTSLPIRLTSQRQKDVTVSHWADGSSRNEFKLYAGNRSAYGIASAMLQGTRDKPKGEKALGDLKTHGIATLLANERDVLISKPFDVLTRMGGSFNMDPRGAWTSIDAGYSPNRHTTLMVMASPVVEFLAAWGLEHTRPDEFKTRDVRYHVWNHPLPLMLARPALGGAPLPFLTRRFRFTLDLSGKNKVVTFADEETIQ